MSREYEQWEEEERRAAAAYEKERTARRSKLTARKQKRQKHLLKLGIMALAGAGLLILMIFAMKAAFGNPIKRTMRVEAGSPLPSARDFLKNQKSKKEVVILSDLTGLTTAHPSETDVVLSVNGRERKSKLIIEDTTPPVAEASPINVSAGTVVAPEDMVKNVVDATDLTYEFENTPNATDLGAKPVVVFIRDEGGNQIKVTTELNVVNDTEAPVISGVVPLATLQGEAVEYNNGITAKDNVDRDVTVQVDTSKVDLNKAGTYPVIYYAVDNSGNRAEASTSIVVEAKGSDWVEMDVINALADKVLEEIVDEGMTPEQKARAIFNYVHTNIWYQDGAHGDSWTADAERGFQTHGGDAYVYAAAARALLNRVGIECTMIDRDVKGQEDSSPSRWLLVNLGTGWYHFDAVPWLDGDEIFMWTDEEIAAFSAEHKNSHVFNSELYPAREKTPYAAAGTEETEESGE